MEGHAASRRREKPSPGENKNPSHPTIRNTSGNKSEASLPATPPPPLSTCVRSHDHCYPVQESLRHATYLFDDAVELDEVPLSDSLGKAEVGLEGHHEAFLVEHRTLRHFSEKELTDEGKAKTRKSEQKVRTKRQNRKTGEKGTFRGSTTRRCREDIARRGLSYECPVSLWERPAGRLRNLSRDAM